MLVIPLLLLLVFHLISAHTKFEKVPTVSKLSFCLKPWREAFFTLGVGWQQLLRHIWRSLFGATQSEPRKKETEKISQIYGGHLPAHDNRMHQLKPALKHSVGTLYF